MAVPAHDSRDWEFAKKFGLPIIEVVKGNTPAMWRRLPLPMLPPARMVNSGFLTGLTVKMPSEKMYAWLDRKRQGRKVNFKLRDWVFSRQRYWGEPIPMVTAKSAAGSPSPKSELPLRLPEVYRL